MKSQIKRSPGVHLDIRGSEEISEYDRSANSALLGSDLLGDQELHDPDGLRDLALDPAAPIDDDVPGVTSPCFADLLVDLASLLDGLEPVLIALLAVLIRLGHRERLEMDNCGIPRVRGNRIHAVLRAELR